MITPKMIQPPHCPIPGESLARWQWRASQQMFESLPWWAKTGQRAPKDIEAEILARMSPEDVAKATGVA